MTSPSQINAIHRCPLYCTHRESKLFTRNINEINNWTVPKIRHVLKFQTCRIISVRTTDLRCIWEESRQNIAKVQSLGQGFRLPAIASFDVEMKHHNITQVLTSLWAKHLMPPSEKGRICKLVSPEHADRLFTVRGKKHKLQNHNDAARFTTWYWMLKCCRVAEESSTRALRQGVFMGQGCSTVQMTGTECLVVSCK